MIAIYNDQNRGWFAIAYWYNCTDTILRVGGGAFDHSENHILLVYTKMSLRSNHLKNILFVVENKITVQQVDLAHLQRWVDDVFGSVKTFEISNVDHTKMLYRRATAIRKLM